MKNIQAGRLGVFEEYPQEGGVLCERVTSTFSSIPHRKEARPEPKETTSFIYRRGLLPSGSERRAGDSKNKRHVEE